MEHEHPALVAWAKIAFAWITYVGSIVGSITLPQWQSIVAIVGGVCVIAFTILQIYVLWRDKIVKYRPNKRTRSTDTSPVPLGD